MAALLCYSFKPLLTIFKCTRDVLRSLPFGLNNHWVKLTLSVIVFFWDKMQLLEYGKTLHHHSYFTRSLPYKISLFLNSYCCRCDHCHIWIFRPWQLHTERHSIKSYLLNTFRTRFSVHSAYHSLTSNFTLHATCTNSRPQFQNTWNKTLLCFV